jgi:hypothetical protein
VGEAKKVKRFWFAETAHPSALRRTASELDEPRLPRMKRQGEVRETRSHISPKPLGVGLVLEADDEVSRPAESHRQALAEPDVRLSPHPAPIVQPYPCSIRQ